MFRWAVRKYLEHRAGWLLWSAVTAEEPRAKDEYFEQHRTLLAAAAILDG